MTANEQRALICMGRPFTPYFADPADGVTTTARRLLVYEFPSTGTPPSDIVGILSLSFEAFAPDITFVGRSA